jgi:hypothetical protein
MRRCRAFVLCAAWLAVPAGAAAQLPEGPYVAAEGRLTLAGELSATISRTDEEAYFNYTDYEHDALRTVRARVLGEWRASPQIALLGELRVENEDSIEAAALYLRWRPWVRREFDVQVGRIPPVLGAFARHAYGRENLVMGAPLAYQYLTSLRPDAIPASADDLLRMRTRGWRPFFPIGSQEPAAGLPLVTASQWDTGAEAHWRAGRVSLAGAITRGAPAAPAPLDGRAGPSWSGRVAVAAAPGLTLGVSGARGRWLDRGVLAGRPEASDRDADQSLVGADLEFGLGRWLVRAEWLRSAFEMPVLNAPAIDSPLTAASGFVEARYRWHPRWQTAVRVERLTFSTIKGTVEGGASTPWDAPVRRIEAAIGFRAARNLELRTGWQHDWRDAGRVQERGYPVVQALYWY